MSETKAPTPEEKEVNRAIVSEFIRYMDTVISNPGELTEQTEAKALLEALQERGAAGGVEIKSDSLLAKLFLSFAAGLDAGLKMAFEQLVEGAQE